MCHRNCQRGISGCFIGNRMPNLQLHIKAMISVHFSDIDFRSSFTRIRMHIVLLSNRFIISSGYVRMVRYDVKHILKSCFPGFSITMVIITKLVEQNYGSDCSFVIACDRLQYSDVIMGALVSQVTVVSIVYWNVCSSEDQRKHQCFASLALVRGIHRWPVNSPHKGPVTRKMFPLPRHM